VIDAQSSNLLPLHPSALLFAVMAEVHTLFNSIGIAARNHNTASLEQVLKLYFPSPLDPQTQNEVLRIKAVQPPSTLLLLFCSSNS
jgi:hypothetical protein